MISLALVCIALAGGSDHITAVDLGFDGIAPATPVALAPAPGVQRMFRMPELQRLAARFNVEHVPEKDVCIERRTVPLDRTRVMEAMQRQLPAAKIEILETSLFNVPDGELDFPVAGLRQTPGGGFWSGAIQYGGGRRFLIWAKVNLLMTTTRVIAVEALRAGQTIESTQLRLETRDDFPVVGAFAGSLDEAAGKIVRRAVPAGMAIQKQWLESAKDIARGDTVHVEVHSGAAVLAFEGQAETGGSTGQNIRIINPSSKKRFQARVEGKGKVTVGKGTL